MDAVLIASEYFPGESPATLLHLLRSYTRYPAHQSRRDEPQLRRELQACQQAREAGLEMCLGCATARAPADLTRYGWCPACAVSPTRAHRRAA